jgi:sigma-B regulation protein RsbU (phosphoserine phosphatase)
VLSDEGALVMINKAFRERLGLASDEIIKIDELLAVGSRVFYQTHLLPLIKLQEEASEIFLSFKTRSDEFLPVLLNIVSIREEGNLEFHFAGIQISQRNKFEKEIIEARDVAEKALLDNADLVKLKTELELKHYLIEKQLQQISRLTNQQKQIDKVLSHDLQEPLRKISFFASKIEYEGKQIDTNISKILTASERLQKLLSRMQRLHALDYLKLKRAPINLFDVVEKVKKRKHLETEEILITVESTLAFKADDAHLTRLFEELFDNSLKFKNPDKPLEINIATDQFVQNIFFETENKYKYGNYTRIIYSDNGSGFENIYSKLVFDLFKKLHTNDGLGIGLAYVKRIVELHGGTISVESNILHGTKFTILIPMAII